MRTIFRVLLLALAGAASVASAAPSDDTAAVDLALAMRGAFVERARALQQLLPHDLRTRVLLSLPPFVTDADRKLILEDDRDLASLVEEARGSTDPIVLSHLARRCGTTGKVCDALQMAQRWVDADTQNQAAWLLLGDMQRARHDEAAATATFLRASRASLWRDYFTETGRHLLRLLPLDLSASDRAEALLTISGVEGLTPNAFQFIHAECKDVELRSACHRILTTMYDGADTLRAMAVVSRVSATCGVPALTVAERFKTFDAMGIGIRLVRLPDLDGEATTDADYAAFNRAFEARLERGERVWARTELAAAGLTDEQAAARARQERVERDGRRMTPAAR